MIQLFQRLPILVLLFLSGTALLAQNAPPPPAVIKETSTNANDSSAALVVGDTLAAAFPGGDVALTKFLQENINYPQRCKDSSYTATIYMQFVVEKDGSISNIQPLRESKDCPEFVEECRRIIGRMPRWQPGRIQGRPVRVSCNVPVTFTIR